MIRFRILCFLDWLIDKVSPPPDFGPFGVIMLNPLTGVPRPMDQRDMGILEGEDIAEWKAIQNEFWANLERDAVRLHGPNILKEQ